MGIWAGPLGPMPATDDDCPDTPHGAIVDRANQRGALCADGDHHVRVPDHDGDEPARPGHLPDVREGHERQQHVRRALQHDDPLRGVHPRQVQGCPHRVPQHAQVSNGEYVQPLDSVGSRAMHGESSGCIRVLPDDAVKIWDWLSHRRRSPRHQLTRCERSRLDVGRRRVGEVAVQERQAFDALAACSGHQRQAKPARFTGARPSTVSSMWRSMPSSARVRPACERALGDVFDLALRVVEVVGDQLARRHRLAQGLHERVEAQVVAVVVRAVAALEVDDQQPALAAERLADLRGRPCRRTRWCPAAATWPRPPARAAPTGAGAGSPAGTWCVRSTARLRSSAHSASVRPATNAPRAVGLVGQAGQRFVDHLRGRGLAAPVERQLDGLVGDEPGGGGWAATRSRRAAGGSTSQPCTLARKRLADPQRLAAAGVPESSATASVASRDEVGRRTPGRTRAARRCAASAPACAPARG